MPDECRPPEGTADGSWCMLARTRADEPWYMAARWTDEEYGGAWFWARPDQGGQVLSLPRHMAEREWRFHSIAEVPHE